MRIFVEKVILALAVPALVTLFANPMGFDWQQRLFSIIGILCFAYVIAYSLQKQQSALPSPPAAAPPSVSNQSQPLIKPTIATLLKAFDQSSGSFQHKFPTSSRDAVVFRRSLGAAVTYSVTGTNGTPAISLGTAVSLGSSLSAQVAPYMDAVPLNFDRAFETDQTIDFAFRNVSDSFKAYNIEAGCHILFHSNDPDFQGLTLAACPDLPALTEHGPCAAGIGPRPPELKELKRKEKGLWIYGKIRYSDDPDNRNKHETRFCYVFRGKPDDLLEECSTASHNSKY